MANNDVDALKSQLQEAQKKYKFLLNQDGPDRNVSPGVVRAQIKSLQSQIASAEAAPEGTEEGTSSEDIMEQYDVAGTPWAGEVKKLFSTPEAIPEDLSEWRVTGGRKNYSITFKDGTSIPLTGLSKYDDERGRLQQLVDNLGAYRETIPVEEPEVEETEEVVTEEEPVVDASLQPGPVVTPTVETPDPIPTTVDEPGQVVTAQTQAPTYEPLEDFTPTVYEETPKTTTSVMPPETGTMSTPVATANLSAVPQTFTYRPDYTGTTMRNLTAPSQGQRTVQNVVYKNDLGQTVNVTEVNGQPSTYVPPGFVRQAPATEVAAAAAKGGLMRSRYAEGGNVQNEALLAIAKLNGYEGTSDSGAVRAFMNSSEGLRAKARAVGAALNKGGAVLFADEGVDVQPGEEEDSFQKNLAEMTKSTITQTMQPRQATVAKIVPDAADFIAPTAGQAAPQAPVVEAAKVESVEQAQMPTAMTAATMDATTVAPQVKAETAALEAAQGTISPQAQIEAQQQVSSSVSELDAAQGTAIMMDNPVQREIQQGELISGVADAQKAAEFNEQIQAAEATPSKQATVQGQLEGLMQQFEGGNTPAWAAGSMRQATAVLAARGLGASSMAGQAIIQATMEAALPIAQMDAQTQAQFESQNLSNRQQRAMLAAQQRAQFLGQEFDQAFQSRVANSARIGDIANMNFTAEQQVALENSRAANTMNLNNLSNRQAMVIAEASALANMDMSNLNNRQQAAVQNAQNFLQMDMANLSNEQQTTMFKSQQNLQALFTDQAATNAAAQFNASSENQTEQFFASLSNQTSQFNAAQTNAMNQFNVNSVNALREFNAEVQQQRDLFNAQNGLVVAQANAKWRQDIATMNTAAQNESNREFAKTMNNMTSTNLDAYWQRERDTMAFAYASAESAADRISQVTLQELSAEQKADYADQVGKGSLTASLLKGGLNYMAGADIF